MRRALALAVGCAGLLTAAGCGEDQQFIDDYNEATKPLQTLRADLGSAADDATRREGASKQIMRQADEAKRVNDDLADLEAPDDAKADFNELRAALRRSEADLRELGRATQSDDIAKLTSATQALARDARAIDRAEAAVKRKVED